MSRHPLSGHIHGFTIHGPRQGKGKAVQHAVATGESRGLRQGDSQLNAYSLASQRSTPSTPSTPMKHSIIAASCALALISACGFGGGHPRTKGTSPPVSAADQSASPGRAHAAELLDAGAASGGVSAGAIQDQMTLRCRFGASAVLKAHKNEVAGKVTREPQESSQTLEFVVVDGRLVIVGPDGGEKLALVGRNVEKGAMFFLETTPVGNVVLWSFYPLSEGRVLWSKQNNYGLGRTAEDGVSAWNHVGYCDATGGNGRAILQ